MSYEDTMDKVRIKLNSTKGIEQILVLNYADRMKIIELEREDEKAKSVLFGKKNNIGVKKALNCDVLMAFLTNSEFGWPENVIKLIDGDQIIGGDITDPVKLQEYQDHSGYCVFGNIVVELDKLVKKDPSSDPICMVVNPKPFPHIDHIPGISDALMASPSRFTDEYLRMRSQSKGKKGCLGTFLLGFNINSHLFLNHAQCASVRSTI